LARTISASELAARLESGGELALIDPRREGDFAADHLFWATNLPLSLMELRIAELVPRRHTPIVLCDASDGSAAEAANLLGELGYGDVAILGGGCRAWVEAGFQLFSGVNVPSKAFGEFIEHAADTPHVAPEELAALREAGRDLAIFDARPLQEYGVMNIPGAVNCPGGDLVYRLLDSLPSAETLVIVNCAGDTQHHGSAEPARCRHA